MLDTRHCRVTIIKSEACTPAIAAASVRHFVRQVTLFTLRPARVLRTVDSVRLNPSAQEVQIAPDVHRNLKLAIAALEDLEGHRTSANVASARGKLAVHHDNVCTIYNERLTLRNLLFLSAQRHIADGMQFSQRQPLISLESHQRRHQEQHQQLPYCLHKAQQQIPAHRQNQQSRINLVKRPKSEKLRLEKPSLWRQQQVFKLQSKATLHKLQP